MRTRHLLVATMLLSLGYVPTAHAALPELKGTTVVTGSSTGAMKVRLTKAVAVSFEMNAARTDGVHTTFVGDGRMLALGLVRAKGDETWFVRSHLCMTAGCGAAEPKFAAARWLPNGYDYPRTTLQPGTYTLYWVADGKPARVTLRLKGLAGRTTLRPAPLRAPVRGTSLTQDAVDPVTSTGARTYSADTEVSLPAGGRLIHSTWVRSERMDFHTSYCIEGRDVPRDSPDWCGPGNAWGLSERSSIACLCPVFREESWYGGLSWNPLAPDSYVLETRAEYAGMFGETGFAVAVVPEFKG